MQFSQYGVVVGILTLPCWLWACSPGSGSGDAGGSESGGGGSSGSSRGGSSGTIGLGGTAGVITQGGSSGTDGTGGAGECVTCTPPGGMYCGQIGDNCGGSMDCGLCMGDWTCEQHVCVGGPSCEPLTCEYASGRYCGTVGNGCGRALDCGACTDGKECRNGVCVAPGCVPLGCAFAGGSFCGEIGDGCGGVLDCGNCTDEKTCAGGGLPNVCGSADCTPVSCTPAGGGQYCGRIGNGCGGALDCGECASGMPCGTGANAHVCPGASTGCTGLACQVETCAGGVKTSLSGVVRDPAGRTPLYNVLVYVPNEPLTDIPTGASCHRCGEVSGRPIATALTNTRGEFRLEGVPTATNVPLVIQIGKWRRQITIPSVIGCRDNPITDQNLTRLPKNQSEGHIPKIAITLGGSDAIECLLRKIGIADSEFTPASGSGRVNLFSDTASPTSMANGMALTQANSLWSNRTQLMGYDIMMMSCTGTDNDSHSTAQHENVLAYADAGGRIFGSHWHNGWINPENYPPFPAVVDFASGAHGFDDPITAQIDTTFPKGMAFSEWLVNVGASTTAGQIVINGAEHSVDAVMGGAQRWIYGHDAEKNTPMVQYFSFNTPVGGMECGRMVWSDVHVSAGAGTDSGKVPFPTGCTSTTLSPQELALEFMFFDLSACVQPDSSTPIPPPPP
ncbi:MAG TPA: carboxypeptidase-like regulatory domain-containing protein, partial [Polyangiaceae bacterium]